MIRKIEVNRFFIAILFIFNLLFAQELKTLTKSEIVWLNSLKEPITIGITTIPNQVIKDSSGKFSGFSIDLFRLIEQKLGIKFKYIYFDSWEKVLDAAKKEKIDIVFLAQKTASRLKFLHFTDTILTQQNRLITKVDKEFNSLDDLKGKKLAITAKSAIEDFIRGYYPQIEIVPTKGAKESLEAVFLNRADATILEPVRASYFIQKCNLNSLKISGDINYNYYLSIASIESKHYLNTILNKTLKSIDKDEIKALKLKWGYIKDKKLFFDKQTLIYLAIAFGIIIPFSIYLFVINQKLKKEMREKQTALNRVIKLRDSKLNEMSQTISMIAHQWRQPLNNLAILIQSFILKYKKGYINNEILEYFDKEAKKQIKLMSKTIDDFMDLFKITEEKEEFDLKETIKNLVKTVSPVMKKHNIKIIFFYKGDNFKVISYQNVIFQVLLNIIYNAQDIILKREIKDGLIQIKLKREEDKILIKIEDNGGGIDEAIIDKIFDPYFSTKTKKNGTGLGLYMAKVMLEDRLNGKISVKNGPQGAIFEIIL